MVTTMSKSPVREGFVYFRYFIVRASRDGIYVPIAAFVYRDDAFKFIEASHDCEVVDNEDGPERPI